MDTGGQRSERKKWINVLGDEAFVVFIASLCGKEEMLIEDEKTVSAVAIPLTKLMLSHVDLRRMVIQIRLLYGTVC